MSKKPRVQGNARAPKIRRTPEHLDPDLERMRGEVIAYVRCGLNVEQIATQLGIAPRTVADHFAHELETAAHAANKVVGMNLYRLAANLDAEGQAGKGNVGEAVQLQAATAWLKMRAGWSDKSDSAARVQVNVAGGNVQVNVEALAGEDLDVLEGLLAKMLPT